MGYKSLHVTKCNICRLAFTILKQYRSISVLSYFVLNKIASKIRDRGSDLYVGIDMVTIQMVWEALGKGRV